MRCLFITRHSLDQGSAIGAQTGRLVQASDQAMHVWWSGRARHLPGVASLPLERLLLARGSRFFPPSLRKAAAQFGFRHFWHDHRLINPSGLDRFDRLAAAADVQYVAPLDRADAARIRFLVERSQKPFVIHLWDFLDARPSDGSDFVWLIQNAKRSFSLCESIDVAVRPFGVEPHRLIFTRDPSASHVTQFDATPMKIALMGSVSAYVSGLEVLGRAFERSAQLRHSAVIEYRGDRHQIKGIRRIFGDQVRTLPFARDQRELDAWLASCSIGFLSGPGEPPESSLRSAFSIPSRVLDFIANGLPVAGWIHPESATRIFADAFGIGDGLLHNDESALVAALESLMRYERRRAASIESDSAFKKILADDPVATLRDALNEISAP